MRIVERGFLGAVALLLVTGGAFAQSPAPFDMKGTWKGTGEGIVDGPTAYHPPSSDGTKAAGTYRLRSATYTYKIEGQDGRRFWGTVGSDVFANERLIGSLSADGKWIYMAGKEGILDGQIIDPDTIEMCYRHANANSAVVGCNQMKRQK